MSCGGCSGAIERALTKAKADASTGITDFTVDLKSQLVQVNSTNSLEDVQQRIAKTGKTIKSAQVV